MVKAASVLIGGGTGFVGRHLVHLLKKGGAKVRIITRNPGSRPDHVSWDTIKDKGLPEGTTAVVNLAGRNILEPGPMTKAYRDEVYNSRIGTNKLLVNAIHAAPIKPRAFIATSGVGYYAPSESFEYDENWAQPKAAKGGSGSRGNYLMDLAREWEKASELSESLAPTTRRVIIRSGVVLGGGGGVIANLRLPFSLGLGGPIGSGNQWFPWIHVDDLANMFKFAIINDHVSGVINGVAPEVVRNREFTSAFGRTLRRPACIPMPSFVTNTIFGSERAEILLKGQRVKSRSELLGFRYEYPTLEHALKQSLGG